MPTNKSSGRSKVRLSRAALYGAAFSSVLYLIHVWAGDADVTVGNDGVERVIGFIAYLIPGALLFVGIGYLRNRFLARKRDAP